MSKFSVLNPRCAVPYPPLRIVSKLILWFVVWNWGFLWFDSSAFASTTSLEQRIRTHSKRATTPELDPALRDRLQTQIHFLQSLQNQMTPPSNCQATSHLDESQLEAAEELFTQVKKYDVPDISPLDIWELSQYIEVNADMWREHPLQPIVPFPLRRSKELGHLPVEFSFDNQKRLFVDFHLPISSGSFGSVYRLFGYRTRVNAAKKIMKLPDRSLAEQLSPRSRSKLDKSAQSVVLSFRDECVNLKKVSALAPHDQVGLVETFNIKNGEIVQNLYDEDLGHYLWSARSQGRQIAEADVMKLYLQLGKGLDTLHSKLGMVHSDIKPNNILLSFPTNAEGIIQAVHADFGLSYDAARSALHDSNYKPNGGTLDFMPPEHFRNWTGNSLAEKVENAKKGDVFALSASLAEAIRPTLLGWRKCGSPKTHSYRACFDAVFADMQRSLEQTPDPISEFLLQGMSAVPQSRPSASQWTHQLRSLLEPSVTTTDPGHIEELRNQGFNAPSLVDIKDLASGESDRTSSEKRRLLRGDLTGSRSLDMLAIRSSPPSPLTPSVPPVLRSAPVRSGYRPILIDRARSTPTGIADSVPAVRPERLRVNSNAPPERDDSSSRSEGHFIDISLDGSLLSRRQALNRFYRYDRPSEQKSLSEKSFAPHPSLFDLPRMRLLRRLEELPSHPRDD